MTGGGGHRHLLRLHHPIGHQNDALILGPGDFRFGDYWNQGLSLGVLVVFSRAFGGPSRPATYPP